MVVLDASIVRIMKEVHYQSSNPQKLHHVYLNGPFNSDVDGNHHSVETLGLSQLKAESEKAAVMGYIQSENLDTLISHKVINAVDDDKWDQLSMLLSSLAEQIDLCLGLLCDLSFWVEQDDKLSKTKAIYTLQLVFTTIYMIETIFVNITWRVLILENNIEELLKKNKKLLNKYKKYATFYNEYNNQSNFIPPSKIVDIVETIKSSGLKPKSYKLINSNTRMHLDSSVQKVGYFRHLSSHRVPISTMYTMLDLNDFKNLSVKALEAFQAEIKCYLEEFSRLFERELAIRYEDIQASPGEYGINAKDGVVVYQNMNQRIFVDGPIVSGTKAKLTSNPLQPL